MIEYILLSSTIVFLGVFAYIKIKYPFWNNQPVYHSYDIWRTMYKNPFIIRTTRPQKTKFCDFTNIKTVDYLEISEFEKTSLLDLLQCYYIPTEEIIHTLKQDDIDAYLSGQLYSSYVSTYIDFEYQVLKSKKNEPETIKTIPKPIGCITSRSLCFLYVDPVKKTEYIEMPIYYIDFLAVNNKKDTALLSRKLLQTHEYYQRIHNTKIQVSLLKKEIELFDGIVPLIKYPTYLFSLRNIHFPRLPAHHEVLQITTENIDILLDFLYIQKNIDFKSELAFDILVFPDIGNIISLIKQGLLFVFCLRQGENIYGMYFIKDAKIQYEKLNQEDIENNTLQTCGSISNCESNDLFFLGYLHGLRQIIEKYKKFRMILMETIGHNCYLFGHWRDKHTPIFKNDTAYYLFNMIYPCSPVEPTRCFILL
jgi:hypothetical protein